MFAAQLQSGDLVELPPPVSVSGRVRYWSNVKPPQYRFARHLVGLFDVVAKKVNESLIESRASRVLAVDQPVPVLLPPK